MGASTYVQINLIPIIVLVIMRLNMRQALTFSWRNRVLRFVIVLLIGLLFSDMMGWLLDGSPSLAARIFLWAFNMAYFAMSAFLPYLWFLYVFDIVTNGVGQKGVRAIPPAIPLVLFLIVLATTPLTRAIFYIDGQGRYHRGGLIFLLHALLVVYIGGATLIALVRLRKEVADDRKKELIRLALFALLPSCGMALQVRFYGLDIAWPLVAVSLLSIYINDQQEQVTRDGLTGLNNRRRLDQYIKDLSEQPGGDWYFMIVDVDKFKRINDTYGHAIGDVVLKGVADQIKKVFGPRKSFLARYGGDEFVIIIHGVDEEELGRCIDRMRDGIAGMAWENGRCPWSVTLSVGYAHCSESQLDIENLMIMADTRMYRQKKGR